MSAAPWFRFYPSDWRADPALRMCSVAARGLWMEMLCVMHEAEPRGYLFVKGKKVTERQIASLVGVTEDEARTLIAELESVDVFSRDQDGVIFSRKMVRDTEKALKDKEYGKGGGNPRLKGRVNPNLKAKKNPNDKAHGNGSGSKETPTSPEEASTREAELDRLENELREAAGLDDDPSPSLFDTSPIHALLRSGYDLRRDILPPLRAAKAAGQRAGTWAYYAKIIESKKHKNDTIKPVVEAAKVATLWVTEDDPRWPDLAARYQREKGRSLSPTGSRHRPGMGYEFPADWLEQEAA